MLSIQRLFRRIFWEWIIIAIVLVPCIGLLSAQPTSKGGFLIYDTLMPFTSAPIDSRILLITIDEASILAIGRWPWPRDVHTRLLNKLAQLSPKSVLYDVIFTEPDPDPQVDIRLGEAMARLGNVVVPTLRAPNPQPGEQPHFLTPIGPVARGAKAVGQIYIRPGVDGVMRSVFLSEGNAQKQLNQLSLLAWTVTLPASEQQAIPAHCCVTDLGGQWFGWNEVFIPFDRGNPPVNRVSAVDVLSGNIPSDSLRYKYILVGTTAAGLGDIYATPQTSSRGAMAGVTINAYLLSSLLNHHLITKIPTWVSVSISMFSVLLFLGLLLTSRLRLTFLVCMSFIVACLILSAVLLEMGRWWSPAASALGIALAYLFWSWRRLNSIVTYFSLEANSIIQDLKSQSALPKPIYHADKIFHQTLALATMIDHVRSSRRFIAQSLDSLPLAIFVTDLEGQVLLANLSALTLQTSEAHESPTPISKDIFQILRDIEDLNKAKQMSREKPWHNEERNTQRLDGQVLLTPSGRSFKIRIYTLDTEKSEITGWLVELLEFTIERLAEEQRDRILRFLSHDLRAPQAAIMALFEIQEKSAHPLPAHELRRHIECQVKRTLDLTDSFILLDVAKSMPLEFVELLMGALVMDAVDQAWPLAQNKNIRIEQVFINDENCVVNGSRELLTRAIFNLLENAVKYSEPSTVLHLQLSLSDSEVLLVIQDEGQGISEEDLPHIFHEFRQIKKVSTRSDGYGLGLAFVNSVVQRHGARIECTSQLDIGTTFKLYFLAV